MAEKWTNGRPEWFELDRQHPLHRGLVFAGLGNIAGSVRYHDSSCARSDGTITGGATWSSALGRIVLATNGSSQYVTMPTGPGFGSQYTVCAWGLVSSDQLAVLVDQNALDALIHVGMSDFRWQTKQDSNYELKTTITRSLNKWYHYAATSLGTATGLNALYIDGINRAGGDVYASPAGPLTIARQGTAANRYWPGLIADVLVYRNRCLSSGEVQQLADPSNVMLSGLILPPRRKWWPVVGGAPPAAGMIGVIGGVCGPISSA